MNMMMMGVAKDSGTQKSVSGYKYGDNEDSFSRANNNHEVYYYSCTESSQRQLTGSVSCNRLTSTSAFNCKKTMSKSGIRSAILVDTFLSVSGSTS